MNLPGPLCLCGFTVEGKPVIGGAFQMADTNGFPLECSLEQAQKHGVVISIPHYFASAIEHGWDNEQAFDKISEALRERRDTDCYEHLKLGLIAIFMEVAKTMPGKNAMEIARKMRENLESDVRVQENG